MPTVYILRSMRDPAQRYIGLTNDLAARLAKHNSGGSPHPAVNPPIGAMRGTAVPAAAPAPARGIAGK